MASSIMPALRWSTDSRPPLEDLGCSRGRRNPEGENVDGNRPSTCHEPKHRKVAEAEANLELQSRTIALDQRFPDITSSTAVRSRSPLCALSNCSVGVARVRGYTPQDTHHPHSQDTQRS